MTTIAASSEAPNAPINEPSYLTADYTIRSWLLTKDHKRIAVLYMAVITIFFFVGGAAATVMRLELLTPASDLVRPDWYNRLFTMHGVVMVWLFLIPSGGAVGRCCFASVTLNPAFGAPALWPWRAPAGIGAHHARHQSHPRQPASFRRRSEAARATAHGEVSPRN